MHIFSFRPGTSYGSPFTEDYEMAMVFNNIDFKSLSLCECTLRFVPGYILIIVVPVLVGLFLLCCGCCIYCKCCRGSNKSWKKEEERLNAKRQERELKAQERKSDRKKTTDQLRMKYGLLKSDDEEQLIT